MTELNMNEIELGCDDSVSRESSACDHEAFREAFEQHNDALEALQPPPEVAAAHNRLVHVFESVANVVAAPTEDLVATAADNRDIARFEQLWNEWRDAVSTHYGVLFYSMEGASMDPALSHGEVVLPAMYQGDPIERFEILVFEFHLDPERHFIKRVIALPGETVEIRDGVIRIDGVPIAGDAYAPAPADYTYGPRSVPEGRYFVLGDNRNNSYDSHAWGGQCPSDDACEFVPSEHILGVLPADTRGLR